MIQLQNNESLAIIKALEDGSARERRYAANLIEKKMTEEERIKLDKINENTTNAIKDQAVKEYIANLKKTE